MLHMKVKRASPKSSHNKEIFFSFILYLYEMTYHVWIMTYCGKLLERREYQTILSVSWETCMWVKKQELEPCMEQLIGSGLGQENDKSFYHYSV